MRVSMSLQNMSLLSTDPIRAMLGMATYSDNTAFTLQALGEMGAVYKAEYVVPSAGTTGSGFYQFMLLGVKK